MKSMIDDKIAVILAVTFLVSLVVIVGAFCHPLQKGIFDIVKQGLTGLFALATGFATGYGYALNAANKKSEKEEKKEDGNRV